MTREDIATITSEGESETLEFKLTTGTRREAARTVCAMLNNSGGQVIFGVSPEGSVLGQDVTDRTVERVTEEIQRIEPQAPVSIKRVAVGGGKQVVVVQVGAGPRLPYSYRRVPYRRVGNSTLEMSTDEYNRMLFERLHQDQRWENQTASDWSVEDLSATEIRRTVSEAVRRGRLPDMGTSEPVELLRGLKLLTRGGISRAAVVLFGSPDRLAVEFPQCLLRVARFRGVDKSEFLDNRRFNGNALELLAAAERFLIETLPVAGRIEPGRMDRIDVPQYPPLATREALANALCHRDYSNPSASISLAVYDDRLEVTSPGPLHFGLTPEALLGPHDSLPWNPLIANAFYLKGIIETWGGGTIKMTEEATAAGLPRPEIEDSGICVTVRFRSRQAVAEQRPGTELNDFQQQVLAALPPGKDGQAFRDLRDRFPEFSDRQLRRALNALKERGLIASTGRGLQGKWIRVSEPDSRV